MLPGGGGPNFNFSPEFLFLLVRSPFKNLKPFNNPFEQRYPQEEEKKNT
jgi:hypothetical protein